MYRYVAQYHDLEGSTQVDPSRIKSYPINDFMQSVAGRNMAGAAWNLIREKNEQGAAAMQRNEIIRNMSVETGIPEVHLHSAVPYGDTSNVALPTPANRAVVEASARHQRALQVQAANEQMLSEQLEQMKLVQLRHARQNVPTGGYQPPRSVQNHPTPYIPTTHGVQPPVHQGNVAGQPDPAAPCQPPDMSGRSTSPPGTQKKEK